MTAGHMFFCPECRGQRYISDGQGNWARCEACYLLGPPPPPLPPGDKPLLRVVVTTDPAQIAPLTQAMRDALLRHEVMHLIHTLSEKLDVSEATKSEMLAQVGRETGVPVMEFTMTEVDPTDARGFATVASDPVMVEIDRCEKLRVKHGLDSVWSMLEGIDFAQAHPYPAGAMLRYETHWG